MIDYKQASSAIIWLVEPKSHGLRSNRAVALTLALIGPRAWGVITLAEVARIERVSERTLRALLAGITIGLQFTVAQVHVGIPATALAKQVRLLATGQKPDLDPMPQRFFKPKEVAANNGCSTKAVLRAIAAGELRARRISERNLIISEEDIFKWNDTAYRRAVSTTATKGTNGSSGPSK